MIKYFKLVATFLLISCFSYSQNSECRILEKLLTNDTANMIFGFSEFRDLPIVIYDRSRFFTGCSISNIYGRKVIIKSDSTVSSEKNNSAIIIPKVIKQGKRTYFIFIEFKIRSAVGYFKFKEKDNRVIIKKVDVGMY